MPNDEEPSVGRSSPRPAEETADGAGKTSYGIAIVEKRHFECGEE
jgi:hypothetical protein